MCVHCSTTVHMHTQRQYCMCLRTYKLVSAQQQQYAGDQLTCRVTSTGFCLAGESASIRTKRTELQIRRAMKMIGMRVSFLSAMEEEADSGLLAKSGRYSDRAAC